MTFNMPVTMVTNSVAMATKKPSGEAGWVIKKPSLEAHPVGALVTLKVLIQQSEDSLLPSIVCSGVSACLTDECGCDDNSDVFYCPHGPGCITFSQVCDSVADCQDSLDECLCHDSSVQLTCLTDGSFQICLSTNQACLKKEHIGTLSCQGFNESEDCSETYAISPVSEILYENTMRIVLFARSAQGRDLEFPQQKECFNIFNESVYRNGSLTWARELCKRIDVYSSEFGNMIDFYCTNRTQTKDYIFGSAQQICDGVPHCHNGHDELFCPGRFYCSTEDSKVTWVNEEFVCDGVRDCQNGMDECSGCEIDVLSNSKFLIRNNLIAAVAMTTAIMIVVLNVKIGYKTFKESPESKNGKIDRVFRIQIAGYDLMMGLYLGALVSAGIILRFVDEYCQLDYWWRSSSICVTFGCVFSISTHGSFLSITAVSVVRYVKCLDLVDEIPIRLIGWVSGVLGLLNLVHAIIPVIPVWWVEEFFRTSVILTSGAENPFLKKYDEEHLNKMYSLVYNRTSEGGMGSILSDLRNITTKPGIFDYITIGYYGNSPLCVANVFKNQSSYQSYKIGYCVIVSLLLGALSISYMAILLESVKTSRRAGGAAASTGNVKKMAVKLSLMIALASARGPILPPPNHLPLKMFIFEAFLKILTALLYLLSEIGIVSVRGLQSRVWDPKTKQVWWIAGAAEIKNRAKVLIHELSGPGVLLNSRFRLHDSQSLFQNTLQLFSDPLCTVLNKRQHIRYRFEVLIDDLKSTESVEYQKSLISLVNCLIDRTSLPDKRIDLRNEMIALGILDAIKSLRSTQNSSVAQQIIHFYEQKAKDELKLSTSLDPHDPTAMFVLLWKKIAKTPRSNDLIKIIQKLLFTVDTSDLWTAAIEALSGPRTTRGAFLTSPEKAVEERSKTIGPPPESYAPPQTLDWRPLTDTKPDSVWGSVSGRQIKVPVRNIGEFFFQTYPAAPKLRFITEEERVSINVFLSALDDNRCRGNAISLIQSAILAGDITQLPDFALRRLPTHIPTCPSLLSALSEYSGDVETLDCSERLLVEVTRIPEYHTRLKCMLGQLDIPSKLERLEGIVGGYCDLVDSLLSPTCPLFDVFKLVLEIGRVLNSEHAVAGFRLEALHQLKNMRSPRQPSLTLLHFVAQSLATTYPASLQFARDLVGKLAECHNMGLEDLDGEVKELDLSLRDIRALLVVASPDVKLQFTSDVVNAGKRATTLKNRRKTLENKSHKFAKFYCESTSDFSVTTFLHSLGRFCEDLTECKDVYDMTCLVAGESKRSKDHRGRVDSGYQSNKTDSSSGNHSNRTESNISYHSNRIDSNSGYHSNKNDGYHSNRTESNSSYHSNRTESNSSHHKVDPKYHDRVDYRDQKENRSFRDYNRADSNRSYNNSNTKRSGSGSDYRRNSEGYQSSENRTSYEEDQERDTVISPGGIITRDFSSRSEEDQECTFPLRALSEVRSVSIESRLISPPPPPPPPPKPQRPADGLWRGSNLRRLHNNYHSVDLSLNRSRSHDYHSNNQMDRYRHSPPTRDNPGVPLPESGESCSSGEESDNPIPRHTTARTVGHNAGVLLAPQPIGGSCRSHQRQHRTDVRDLFGSTSARYGGSTTNINSRPPPPRGRHPQQSSLQAMLRGDQNSKVTKPPPIPKRDPILGGGGRGKRENSRSVPVLYTPYSKPSSMSSLSPPPSGGSFSPPLSPPSSGTLSPPTLSPPSRGIRPYSAGSRGGGTRLRDHRIDEDMEVHHERQSSEPCGGGGMGKRENSRSVPVLYTPYSKPSSMSSLSPPPSGGSFSPPLSPPSSGTLSPPTLSPPSRGIRPYSAGSRGGGTRLRDHRIDEDMEVHHERQSSEPCGGGGGMGKRENSRSVPVLYTPYSKPSSMSSLSPPPSGGSFSPPLSPPSSGTLSPPTLSPPSRGIRPYSAGSRGGGTRLRDHRIDEDMEVHHERQSSEPCGGGTGALFSARYTRGLSVSTSDIAKSGLETEIEISGKTSYYNIDSYTDYWLTFSHTTATSGMGGLSILACVKTGTSYSLKSATGYGWGVSSLTSEDTVGGLTATFVDGVMTCSFTINNSLLPSTSQRLVYGMVGKMVPLYHLKMGHKFERLQSHVTIQLCLIKRYKLCA
eukprot:sb/3460549/